MKRRLAVDPQKISKGCRELNPHLFKHDPHPQVPNPKPQRHQATALERADARETASLRRIRVRFTGYRVRPLDPDNFAGSVKDCLDGLRHAALIPGDEPWRITLETEQVCVRSYNQERTVIEIRDTAVDREGRVVSP